MDPKQKERCIKEVWNELSKCDSFDYYYDMLYYSRREMSTDISRSYMITHTLFRRWIADCIKRKICKNPNICKSSLPDLYPTNSTEYLVEFFGNELRTAITNSGIPDNSYELYRSDEELLNDGFEKYRDGVIIRIPDNIIQYGYYLKYKGEEIIIRLEQPFCRILLYFPKDFSYKTYMQINDFNMDSLLKLMEDGLRSIIEKFKFKMEYMFLFWEHFIDLPLNTQLDLFINSKMGLRVLVENYECYEQVINNSTEDDFFANLHTQNTKAERCDRFYNTIFNIDKNLKKMGEKPLPVWPGFTKMQNRFAPQIKKIPR